MKDRKWARLKTFWRGQVYFNNRHNSVDCVVRDISDGGARLMVSGAAMLPDTIELYIPQKDRGHVADIKWRKGDELGLQFHDAIEVAEQEKAVLADLIRRVKKLESEMAAFRRLSGEMKLPIEGSGI